MKLWVAPVFFLFATASLAKDLTKFEFDPPAQSAQAKGASIGCSFGKLTIPKGLRVYAAGGYGGRELPFQIDQSGHEATQFDIAVNSPGQPVALLLGASEPTIWNISWTKGTRIVAVLVSGYHRQAVAGLGRRVPLLNSTHDNEGPCEYFYIGDEGNAALDPLSRSLFKKPVDRVFPGDEIGRIVVGDPLAAGATLITSASRPPKSFLDRNAPLAGQPGIDNAVAKGMLRPATSADADAWVAAFAAKTPAPGIPPVAGQGIPPPAKLQIYKAYVVLKKFTYPNGLYGGQSVTFFLPRGVPQPAGDPGHSAVYDFNTLLCKGAQCR